ncbi:MAG: KdsC family phosphatase [Gemmatimonadota bacterium]
MSDGIPTAVAGRIRLVVLDVDGVMTDGGIYMGKTADGTPVELKRFEITDQLGIKMLEWADIPVVLVSGRPSPATDLRAEQLGIAYESAPGGYKLVAVERVVERQGVDWDEVALLADDLADVPALRKVALPVAVPDAVPEVAALAAWRTRRRGGAGAVREFAEALLKARGEWTERVEAYCRERSGHPEDDDG